MQEFVMTQRNHLPTKSKLPVVIDCSWLYIIIIADNSDKFLMARYSYWIYKAIQ